MEKFSAYRDPGTGIQPFLTPIPPLGSDLLAKVTLPLRYTLGIVRTTLILFLALVYVTLIEGLCLILLPIPSLYRIVVHIFTYIIGRTILLILGIFWIQVEQFNRKRGFVEEFSVKQVPTWNPKAGDIIVSNWASWIDIVWLAIRFNPIFVLPVPEFLPETPATPRASTPVMNTPGRRTGTGSANIQVPSRATVPRIPIGGFRQVSLVSLINYTGHVPPYGSARPGSKSLTLEELRRRSSRPIIIFPECTTSNGRGLLRFCDVFLQNVPVKDYQVFIMSIRYDPPTDLAPTLTHTIPSTFLNPLPHVFSLTTSLSLAQLSIRRLAPSESPGSRLFITSEVLSDYAGEDPLSETCASLVAQMGKLKRTGLGWEDKSNFLQFYRGKKK
ncbi:hypothetical protein GALMADRAFT_54978 [Galerina marginata CBS 339.88]|uniref:Phospholipid/glycerol acyltransferase domain-containing protein n=1 Tax=Galerina marginata (strain CBS 339.88) TaxID=685588 RepID=A0A067TNE1_GALM3|nr:hypothetical protein GALMADRAFT_54978 [Galerina marginata CBS 339.88]